MEKITLIYSKTIGNAKRFAEWNGLERENWRWFRDPLMALGGIEGPQRNPNCKYQLAQADRIPDEFVEYVRSRGFDTV